MKIPASAIDFLGKSLSFSDISEFLRTLERFRAMLEEENSKYNLTAIGEEADFWIKHICDSVSMLRYLPWTNHSKIIADIGCGAGFPSLPLALSLPSAEIHAIDSSGKKNSFLVQAAASLDMQNLHPLRGRARELAAKKEYSGKFDMIVARAAGSAADIFLESRKMLAGKGYFVFYKTPESVRKEFQDLVKISSKMGYGWELSEHFQLPEGLGQRQFIYGCPVRTRTSTNWARASCATITPPGIDGLGKKGT